MRLQHIIEQVYFRPWFISAEGHASVSRILASKMRGETKKISELDLPDDLINIRPAMTFDADRIAHVHVFGVLGQGLTPIEKSCGNTDYADVVSDLTAAKQGGARGIQLHVDSPGGMCVGALECAKAISVVNVPIIASVTGQMCSAAYFLAAGCDQIVSTASAMVGCIGTIMPWVDESGAWEQEGKVFDPITSSGADLKSTGHGPSITDSQREYLQGQADDYASQFISHILDNRIPDDEAFRGGAYPGERAFGYGLVDMIGGEEDARQLILGMIG